MKKTILLIAILFSIFTLIGCKSEKTTITTNEPTTVEVIDNELLVRPEFKQFMDDYEAFYDEYLEILALYEKNPSSLEYLNKYMKALEKLNEFTKGIKEWENKSLTMAEALYFSEVNLRISQKLQAAQNQQ